LLHTHYTLYRNGPPAPKNLKHILFAHVAPLSIVVS